jgi:pimeloyl-ACP methyl ester carboxylesterase
MGASMGGSAAIYAAGSDRRVRRLVLLDPFLAPHESSLNLLHAMAPAPRWMLEPVLWSVETFFLGGMARRDPLAAAKALTLPILLIQDDGDHICPPARADELARSNRSVRLWIAHDPPMATGARWAGFAGHTAAFRLHPTEANQALSDFLADRPASR